MYQQVVYYYFPSNKAPRLNSRYLPRYMYISFDPMLEAESIAEFIAASTEVNGSNPFGNVAGGTVRVCRSQLLKPPTAQPRHSYGVRMASNDVR